MVNRMGVNSMKLRYRWLLIVIAGIFLLIQPAVGAVTPNKSVIAAGYDYSLAIQKDGSLYAWGDNGDGQLGLGDTTARLIPTRVGNATNWVAVAAGYHHCLGVKADGTLWVWGNNVMGQLGCSEIPLIRRPPSELGATLTGWQWPPETHTVWG